MNHKTIKERFFFFMCTNKHKNLHNVAVDGGGGIDRVAETMPRAALC